MRKRPLKSLSAVAAAGILASLAMVVDRGQAEPSAARADRTGNLSQIGYHDLGGNGFNTDIWAHGNYAYVGTWGVWHPEGIDCPNDGTKVIDISDPANPVHVLNIPAPPGTQTNDVKVSRINTSDFHGDILVVSNEDCVPSGARGFEIWNVSDPTNPAYLSRFGPEQAYDTFEDLTDYGFGVHNTFIFQQDDRAYVIAVFDGAEIFQVLFGFPPEFVTGDVRIFDITDPSNPVQVGDWGTAKNLGIFPFDGNGDDSLNIAHDVWVENDIAYVSYWDAGLVMLDVSDTANPTLISQTEYPNDEQGNTHVAVPAKGGTIVITGDEIIPGTPGWGHLRIFDTQDPTNPQQIATFQTDNSLGTPISEGVFSMHNVVVRGNTAYVSWYSDGLLLIDISQPETPREIGSFVFPDTPDPQGFFSFDKAQNWGVYVHGDLILASDMNSGLYILKRKP